MSLSVHKIYEISETSCLLFKFEVVIVGGLVLVFLDGFWVTVYDNEIVL